MSRRLRPVEDMCEIELMECYGIHFRECYLKSKESDHLLEIRKEIEKRLNSYEKVVEATEEEIEILKRAKDMSNDELLKTFDDYLKILFRSDKEQSYLGTLSREIKRRMKKHDEIENNETD